MSICPILFMMVCIVLVSLQSAANSPWQLESYPLEPAPVVHRSMLQRFNNRFGRGRATPLSGYHLSRNGDGSYSFALLAGVSTTDTQHTAIHCSFWREEDLVYGRAKILFAQTLVPTSSIEQRSTSGAKFTPVHAFGELMDTVLAVIADVEQALQQHPAVQLWEVIDIRGHLGHLNDGLILNHPLAHGGGTSTD